ncbi:acetyl-CoA synthetase-like protein [Neocallimastix lanati (nom. inval.)]|jgi:long-chain acyl-CoA synthetase|uniref:Acetyl-CoA synthetase-like protein n=1 Tax=Neocallimastix californiae TaxID=1754190 RepID=A0A1Y1YYN6_9FUNG|nr:acetyl-CoA synthetase-like protein [Neocallimastix sp. JGI-2020a]ORY03079.1 acetyl-CoA synthetase-like protein [Neocallimastix californiae]|eukprot:ORY03079.1 acetyl-CoA synthetase-like protein [Neocallimastix californiae]
MKITKDFKFAFSVPEAPEVPGETKPYRHFTLKQGEPLKDNTVCPTVYENFMHGYNETEGKGNFLGYRKAVDNGFGPYEWFTYEETLQRIKNFGSALLSDKIGLKPSDPIGIYSINRVEWVITDYGANFNSIISVPLYDTLGLQALQYIINQVEMKVCCASLDKAKKLLENISSYPTLKILISYDPIDDDIKKMAENSSVDVYYFEDLEKEGKENQKEFILPKSDTVGVICYTSGTTGNPKGAILVQDNIVSFSRAIQNLRDNDLFRYITHEDVYLSYLPLAHVFERVVQNTVTYFGGQIGFYQGDTHKILEDVAALRPTLFASVPRLLNRIYDAVWDNINKKGGITAWLFNLAYNSKKRGLKRGRNTHWLWDRIVFNNIRNKLGGNVKAIYSGSAPLSADVTDFLNICFSCDVQEGYGQTETCACLSLTDKWDMESGHVGGPQSPVEVKLRDIEDMGYLSTDKPYPRGEICVRGHSVFRGYYKNPELTKEVLDEDGWFRTGDIGIWDEHNRIVIIDRVKNIFKLAQGEYVAPEKIEEVYLKYPIVNQIFVHGESLESQLVGIIVPKKKEFMEYAVANGVDASLSFEDMCKDKNIIKKLVNDINVHARSHNLKGFETIKNIYLEPHEFTEEENLLSPILKVKRGQALQKYRSIIKGLYDELKRK